MRWFLCCYLNFLISSSSSSTMLFFVVVCLTTPLERLNASKYLRVLHFCEKDNRNCRNNHHNLVRAAISSLGPINFLSDSGRSMITVDLAFFVNEQWTMNNEQWTSPRRLVIVCCPSSYEQYTILETIQATVHSIKFAYVSARNRPLSQFLFPRRFSGIFYVQTNKHGLSGLFSTLLAIQIGPETILQVEGFLMVVEWNLVYFCVKICSLGGISTSGIFRHFCLYLHNQRS
jgi:hypothetical protein